MTTEYKSSSSRRFGGDDEGHCVGFATVVHTTESAIKVDIGTDECEWLPRSQLHDNNEIWERGDEGELWVKTWIAKEKGWI